jgi:ferrous iron transport protein B
MWRRVRPRRSTPALSESLGVPVVPIIASTGFEGLKAIARLRSLPSAEKRSRRSSRGCSAVAGIVPHRSHRLADLLAKAYQERQLQATARSAVAVEQRKGARVVQHALPAGDPRRRHRRAQTTGQSQRGLARRPDRMAVRARRRNPAGRDHRTRARGETFSDKLDRIVTHKVWGTLIFVAVMYLIFQCIFTFAEYPMTWLEKACNGRAITSLAALAPGDLRDLLVNGVVAGVGAVVVFLPQILMLFLFIGLLEDTGYMARAAFLMDRLMSKVGLHGKSFIPMLSSFACAIPGIMATRTIESPKDRLVTILVAPLMSCSARLPVYTLLIGARSRVGQSELRTQPRLHQVQLFGFLGLRG